MPGFHFYKTMKKLPLFLLSLSALALASATSQAQVLFHITTNYTRGTWHGSDPGYYWHNGPVMLDEFPVFRAGFTTNGTTITYAETNSTDNTAALQTAQ